MPIFRKPVYRKNRFTLFHVLRSSQVIIATNFAETSVTIENITFVVDAGIVKQILFNTSRNAFQLLKAPMSQAQANQRAGRGGLGVRMRESAIGFTPNTHTGTAVKCMSGAFAV